MKCPIGHFIMPTRLQASTNKNFCNDVSPTFFKSDNSYAYQRANIYPYLKQVRQMSAELFGDGVLDRLDKPYRPIYVNSSDYWNCVGTNDNYGCEFTVNAADYKGLPASSGASEIVTLVLPGPYCSTVDAYEHVDRSGGVVYRLDFDKISEQNATLIKSLFENHQNELGPTVEADFEIGEEKGEEISIIYPEFLNFNKYQSENVYLVVAAPVISQCQITLYPRDPESAQMVYLENKDQFVTSVLANIHIPFIEIKPGGTDVTSTFYDDMTALQHLRNYDAMFTVDFDDELNAIVLKINHQAKRRFDGEITNVGGGVYEILVVGDQHAMLLGNSWPYRYISPQNNISRNMILFKQIDLGTCVYVENFKQILKFRDGNNVSSMQDDCQFCEWKFWAILCGSILLMVAITTAGLYLW